MNNSTANVTASCEFQDACEIQANFYGYQAVSIRVVKVVPLIIIIFTSLVCNGLICRFVFSDRRTLTATNIIVFSQCLADLGTTSLVIPFAAVSVVKEQWVFGHNFCVANNFFNMYFTVVTLLHLSLIALDRYFAVVRMSHHLIQQKAAIWTVVCIWSAAFVFSFPWLPLLSDKVIVGYFPGFYICGQQFLQPIGRLECGIFVVSCLCCVLCPLCVIIYSFHQISKYIRGKRYRISPTRVLSNAQKLSIDAYAKSAYTALLVNATSIIQVFPACMTMAVDGLQVIEIPRSFETTVKWIMWCHCIVKPMIYAARRRNNSLSIHNKLFNFFNPYMKCFVLCKKQKIKKRNPIWKVKYNARAPSIIFGPKAEASLNKEKKVMVLKKAWSIESDAKFNDISITLHQT
jgi:hypothetical protein